MPQYSTSLRVILLLVLASFLTTTYLVAFRSDISVPSVAHIKTIATERWNHGLSSLMVLSPNRQPAGQGIDDLKKLINDLVEEKMNSSTARIAPSTSLELKKRQSSSDPLSSLLGALSGMSSGAATQAGSNLASGFSGLLSSLEGGISDSLASSVGNASGALGQGLAQGAVTGLNLPTKVGAVMPKPTGAINCAAEMLGEGLSSTFTSEVNVTALLPSSDFGVISRVFAAGLANGTAMGANLTQMNLTPAPGNDTTAIAGNLGFGLTNSFLSAVDLNSLASPQQTQMLMQQVGLSVVPAANGLGTGAAQGLKLTAPGAPSPAMQINPNNVQIPDVAHDFSLSLSQSFLGAVDPSTLANPQRTAMLQQMAIGALPGIGTGLGSGAAAGLGLAKASAVPPANAPPPTDFNSGTQDFSYGLTSSFLGSLDVSKVAAAASSAPMVNLMIGPAAEGLGKGLGEGTAIGLGLRADMPAMPVNSSDMSAVTEAFSRNLVVSFLANGTLQTLSQDAGSLSSLSSNIQISKVAEGFGRGLVDGVGSGLGMDSMPDTFNDTVMGGALGMGKGLGESSVGLVMSFISGNPGLSNLTGISAASPSAPSTSVNASAPALPTSSTPAAGTPPADGTPPAGTAANVPMGGASAVRRATVVRRQDASPAPDSPVEGLLDGVNGGLSTLNTSAVTGKLLANLNVTQIDAFLQKGLDDLTCTGFGGIWSITQGLVDSGTLKTDPLSGSSPIPGFGNTTFTVRQNNNVFEVSPGLGETRTNGVLLKRSILLLALHAGFGSIAFFVVFPIVLMLAGVQDITRMIGRPQLFKNSPRWQLLTQLIAFVPILIATVATGIVVIGNGPHFNTPHKGTGYFLALFGLLWIVTNRASNKSANPGSAKTINLGLVGIMFVFSVVVEITGWNDLATISLCLTQKISVDLYIGVGLLTGSLFANAMTVMGMVFLLGKWLGVPATGPAVMMDGKESPTRMETKSPTARELRRISGPFLPDSRQYL